MERSSRAVTQCTVRYGSTRASPEKATRATHSASHRESPEASLVRASLVPMRSAPLLLGVLGVVHATIELTPDNFDDVVFNSGKAAFVKFLAPW